MDAKQTFSAGGRHKPNTTDLIEYEKVNPKTQKKIEVKKRKCDNCGSSKTQFFNK